MRSAKSAKLPKLYERCGASNFQPRIVSSDGQKYRNAGKPYNLLRATAATKLIRVLDEKV